MKQARRTLAWTEPRTRLVAIADTHSRPHPRAHEQIAKLRPNYILHAGDIGDLCVLDDFGKIAPVVAVRGNIDVKAPNLCDALAIDLLDGEKKLMTLLLLHIAVYGPKLRKEARELAKSLGASLVVCGHSHVPFIGRDRGLGVFNPGSIGPKRFQLPIVFGLIDVARDRLKLQHVDCQTGEPWQPESTAAP